MRILQGVVEAAHQAAANFHPTNEAGEVAANEMRALVREFPELLIELGRMAESMADQCVDEIWMDSGAADVLKAMGKKFSAPAPALQEAAASMDRPHGDDIERIHREDRRAAAWDWSRNQGYSGI